MQEKDSNKRWEFWLEQAQIRTLQNFTETGWAMGHMDEELHSRVLKHFRERLTNTSPNHSVPLYTTGDQTMVRLAGLSNEVKDAVQTQIAAWIGVPTDTLEATSTYGIRNYWKGSTLKTHVDRVETHILSAVYCVDAKYPENAEKWHMEADPDLSGKHVSVDIKPGELFFYESAKLVHGRPSMLQGDYSAHIFVHFRPKGWSFTNVDRVYAVPPNFDKKRIAYRDDEL